jgi:FtsZ-binding cell division protein ZapB
MASATTCPVCCDAYTAKVRAPVVCPACRYAPCVRCAKKFLLSSHADPSCMNCGLHWARAFLDDHFTPAWRGGDLRKHRQRVLFDRERALLPATQPAVERVVTKERLEEGRRRAYETHRATAEQLKESRRAWQEAVAALRHHESGGAAAKQRLEDARRRAYETYRATAKQLQEHRRAWQEAVAALDRHERGGQAPPERRSFVAACPAEDCRGFLSQQYKCGTCLRHFCAACRELKVEGHVCDPALVQSLKAIVADSRACPGCGVAISRVSGCDQMFCVLCEVFFSYATGERIQGVVHNPHYFERLRQLRQQAAPAPEGFEGAGEGACGQWPSIHSFTWLPAESRSFKMLSSFFQTAINLELQVLPRLRRDRRGGNEDLRVQFCLRRLDEARFMAQLERRERQRDFEVDVCDSLQLFVLLTMETMYQLLPLRSRPAPEREELAREQLDGHRRRVSEIVQPALQDIARRYRRPTCSFVFPEEEGVGWRLYQDLCLHRLGPERRWRHGRARWRCA